MNPNLWFHTKDLLKYRKSVLEDCNFDWDVDEGDLNHDKGYDEMIKYGHFIGYDQKILKKTQANPNFNSVLDLIFLGDNSWAWKAKSSILKRDINDIQTII